MGIEKRVLENEGERVNGQWAEEKEARKQKEILRRRGRTKTRP